MSPPAATATATATTIIQTTRAAIAMIKEIDAFLDDWHRLRPTSSHDARSDESCYVSAALPKAQTSADDLQEQRVRDVLDTYRSTYRDHSSSWSGYSSPVSPKTVLPLKRKKAVNNLRKAFEKDTQARPAGISESMEPLDDEVFFQMSPGGGVYGFTFPTSPA